MEVVGTVFDTAVQCTGICRLTEVSRHKHAFADNIFHTDLHWVHMQFLRQLIYCGFQCKNTLRRTVASVGSGCLNIRIDYVAGKSGCLTASGIKRKCFMSGKSYGRSSMFSVGTGIG